MKKVLAFLMVLCLMMGVGFAESPEEGLLPEEAVEAQWELTVFYGMDIHDAAAHIGGLTYFEGVWDEDEDPEGNFYNPDNYENEFMHLMGSGTLYKLCLQGEPSRYTLCGVGVGMTCEAAVSALQTDEAQQESFDTPGEWSDGYYSYTVYVPEIESSMCLYFTYNAENIVNKVTCWAGGFGG